MRRGALPEVLTRGPQRPLYLAGGDKGGGKARDLGCGSCWVIFLAFYSSQTQLLAAPERGWARGRWGPFPLEGWIEGAPPRGFPDDWPRAY